MSRARQVERLVKRYIKLLGLQRWDIEIVLDTEMEDRANCQAAPEYYEAKVKFNLDKITEGDEETYVRHELLHCLVWPCAHTALTLAGDDKVRQEMCRLAEERVTSDLERMPLWKLLDLED